MGMKLEPELNGIHAWKEGSSNAGAQAKHAFHSYLTSHPCQRKATKVAAYQISDPIKSYLDTV